MCVNGWRRITDILKGCLGEGEKGGGVAERGSQGEKGLTNCLINVEGGIVPLRDSNWDCN